MKINRKLIRDNFLKAREAEKREADEIKQMREVEANEIKQMTWEDIYQHRINYYKKHGINKLDMMVEYLIDTHFDSFSWFSTYQ